MTTYKVIRFRKNSKRKEIIRRGFTLDQAREWCSREDTHKVKYDKDGNKNVVWFDGFVVEQ